MYVCMNVCMYVCMNSIPAYSDHWVSNVFDREGFFDYIEV